MTEQVAAAVNDAIGVSGQPRRAIAQETGIPYPTLTRKLAGKTAFSLSELFLIAAATGVTPSHLLPRHDAPRVLTPPAS